MSLTGLCGQSLEGEGAIRGRVSGCHMTRIILFLLVLACLAGTFAPVRAKAAIYIDDAAEKEARQERFERYPGILQPLFEVVARWQSSLKNTLSAFARDIRSHPFGKSFWLFLAFSFAYGLIHALGPGHGKTFACSYFLSRPGRFRQGFLFGYLVILVHVASAVALILVGYFLINGGDQTLARERSVDLELLSYLLLVVVGAFLLSRIIFELITGRFIRQNKCENKADNRSMISLALAGGLVPCSGASLILLLALSQGMVFAGVMAMPFLAAGMGVTTSLVAVTAIGAQKSVYKAVQGGGRLFAWVAVLSSLGGALVITAMGVLLFLGAL